MLMLLWTFLISLSAIGGNPGYPESSRFYSQSSGSAFWKKPASCGAVTTSHCDLSSTNSGQTSGSCTSGYSGTCTFKCFRGQWTSQGNTCAAGCAGAPTRIYLVSGTSWTVPANWTSACNTIEVIGAGGSGRSRKTTTSGAALVGGGGGAYSKVENVVLSAGASIPYFVGAGGTNDSDGGDTFFGSAVYASAIVAAKGGQSGTNGRLGGDSALGIGTVKYSGGNGASAGSSVSSCSGGGGGAAGPLGPGGAAGRGDTDSAGDDAGGGGGGNGGGSSGVNGSSDGGNGGNNSSGTGGGAGGVSANGSPGVQGGGGGGGTAIDPGAGAQGIVVITYYP